jgi:hypothetical protein
MRVNNVLYTWAPTGAYVCVRTFHFVTLPWSEQHLTLQLYPAHTPTSEFLVRMSRSQGMVTLEFTQNALGLGLLNVCIVAAVLLQSGVPID